MSKETAVEYGIFDSNKKQYGMTYSSVDRKDALGDCYDALRDWQFDFPDEKLFIKQRNVVFSDWEIYTKNNNIVLHFETSNPEEDFDVDITREQFKVLKTDADKLNISFEEYVIKILRNELN